MSFRLAEYEFRTLPKLKLVPYNRLSREAHSDYSSFNLSEEGFGLALYDSVDRSIALDIDENTALLLYVLKDEGYLPGFALNAEDVQSESRIFDLVLAGVLEVKKGGVYLSGPAGIDALLASGDQNRRECSSGKRILSDIRCSEHSLVDLSIRAIKSVIESDQVDLVAISNHLYRANSIPHSAKLKRQYHNGEINLKNLVSNEKWQVSDMLPGWHYYTPSTRSVVAESRAKLYVSPLPRDMPTVVRCLSRHLTRYPGVSFKIGSGLSGLLRSDKFVAYFPSKEMLLEATKTIKTDIEHLPSQGVPFTAECTQNGLLSWGIDPLFKESDDSLERKSWRQWIVETIATSIQTLNGGYSHLAIEDKLETVLGKLSVEGVDPGTFKPKTVWIKEHLQR